MALWTGLGQAGMVAQLVGVDLGGLISMIVQSALRTLQNRSECEKLTRRVLMIAELLPHVQEDPEVAQPLAGLGDTLRDAHELVVSYQGRSAAYQFVIAGREAERFREVQSSIDSYLILFPVISHIGITRRLEPIYNVLLQDGSTIGEPSTLPQLQEYIEVDQEVLPHITPEFTFADIMTATSNLAEHTVIGSGGFGKVYKGMLHDGREVPVKRMWKSNQKCPLEDEFHTEIGILSRLQHKHIIRFLGSCVSKDMRPRTTPQKIKKGLLTKWRKEPEHLEKLIVYEYMENGSLDRHLHAYGRSFVPSPVTMSLKVRIDVLLDVSRAIEHMHCHGQILIIHRDIKSSNILFDASWAPRVSDFGLSVVWDMANEESGLEAPCIGGTFGYMAPEYAFTNRVKPATDVYSLGMVMLEVLAGKPASFQWEGAANGTLEDFAIPIIEAGNIEELLDRRPVPEPTPWQLQALKRVARTARRCVKLDRNDRPAISKIVADLEMAYKLICRDEQVQLTS